MPHRRLVAGAAPGVDKTGPGMKRRRSRVCMGSCAMRRATCGGFGDWLWLLSRPPSWLGVCSARVGWVSPGAPATSLVGSKRALLVLRRCAERSRLRLRPPDARTGLWPHGVAPCLQGPQRSGRLPAGQTVRGGGWGSHHGTIAVGGGSCADVGAGSVVALLLLSE